MQMIHALSRALGAALLLSAPALSNEPASPSPSSGPALADEPTPWRLERALGLPEWFSLSFNQRTRYESLDERIGAGQTGSDQLWALRTLLAATLRHDALRLGLEFQDSRQYRAPDDAVLNTTTVNAAEILEAYVGYTFEDAFAKGDSLDVQLGRHTMDVGSRRLVARNRFRNTINGFNGINTVWTSDSKDAVRAFFVVPVNRLPRDQASLQANDVQLDEELDRVHFYGVHAQRPDVLLGATGEAYLLVLNEDDGQEAQTRNRRLYTLGARLNRKPKSGAFHFEWESALQLGRVRATTAAADTTNLDHRAHFHHLSVGYQFARESKPRVEALFDYASGDDDPTDGDSNRFDTLFGARRWEFGPTGIFGAFARANLISPGYRVVFLPHEGWEVMLTHRFHYLASDQDAWTTAGIADPTGTSGRHIGQLAEGRVRVDLVPGNLKLEFGIAHLFAGGFLENAPGVAGPKDSTYGYVATTVSL